MNGGIINWEAIASTTIDVLIVGLIVVFLVAMFADQGRK